MITIAMIKDERKLFFMKRIFSVLLCLALMFSITACKPDNITYPTEIVDPDAEQTQNNQAVEETTPAEDPATQENTPVEETPEADTPQVTDDNPEEAPAEPETTGETQETANETSAEEQVNDPEPAEQTTADGEETKQTTNPLAAEAFKPTTGAMPTLTTSGLIKPSVAVSALKNRTITLYTAGDQPAFSYVDENGATVNEWEWMTKIAAENGFMMKYSVKSSSISVKAQRIALYAGKKLSLLQFGAQDLAAGMTLAASAAAHLDTAAQSYGISKAVLTQSDYKLFSPVGNAESLWYNTALMPEGTDPQTLSQANSWTVEQFKTVCDAAAEKKALPLIMEKNLVWATLSGKSPLTMLDGKLDSNINARATREVWSAVKELDLTALTTAEGSNDLTLKNGTAAFEYTATPETAEGIALNYAPLPALKEGTAGTVTFTGTFLALPKYETAEEAIHAALAFAELWCNRYSETRAAQLQALGVSGAAYQSYCDMAEANGQLILWDAAIEEAVNTYLSGLTNAEVDMDAAYEQAKDRVNALITARNIYY